MRCVCLKVIAFFSIALLPASALAQVQFQMPPVPGAVISTDPNIVCVQGYSARVRPNFQSPQWKAFSNALYAAAGIMPWQHRFVRIDHLVPIALGGAPMDFRNAWIQPVFESKQKDEVEDALLAQACYRHTLSLIEAQQAIANDWTHTPVGLPPIRNHHYGHRE